MRWLPNCEKMPRFRFTSCLRINPNRPAPGDFAKQPCRLSALLSDTAGKEELTMLRIPGIQRSRHRKGLLTASSLLLLLSAAGFAQSGRKNNKPPHPDAPAPKDQTIVPAIGARDLNH